MRKVSVEEAKRKGWLTITHAKIMYKWYDNICDADDYDLKKIGRLVTFEKLDECLEKCGNLFPYIVIPDDGTIAVIIFDLFNNDWQVSRELAENFNRLASDFNINCKMYTADTQFGFTKRNEKKAMQIFCIG